MKNPLNKRYFRELKQDAGRYTVIFLFLSLMIALVAGFLETNQNVARTYYEVAETNRLEDGHLSFNMPLSDELKSTLEEKGEMTLYDLSYAMEDLDDEGTTLRIYRNRTEIDLACLHEGSFPEADDEIALDVLFANVHNIVPGDTVTLNKREYTVTGIVNLPDYTGLYENNSDLMFDANSFGTALVSESGFDALASAHVTLNYAWKYDDEVSTDAEQNAHSEVLLDAVKDVIREYDTKIVQAQVDALYAEAKELSSDLEAQLTKAQEVIEDRMENAAEDAAEKLVNGLSSEKKMQIALAYAGSDSETIAEAMIQAALDEKGITLEEAVAEQLGTTAEALEALEDAMDSAEDLSSEASFDDEAPVISLDEDEEADDVDTEMSFSFDTLNEIIDKIEAAGLYDTAEIRSTVEELTALEDFSINEDELLQLDDYLPKYLNMAVTFMEDDISSDRASFSLFGIIVVLILAFVFAVTTSNSIEMEAGAIGTLRASGYSKAELIRHYLVLPAAVTVAAALAGNLLGYTFIENFFLSIYNTNYSIAPYESQFNYSIFVETTLIPVVIMMMINFVVLFAKLQHRPLDFLRKDFSGKGRKKALPLSSRLPFMVRFSLRVLFQNIPAYITMFAGIVLGGILVVFGLMFTPLLYDYAEIVQEQMIAKYQYVLKEQTETENASAEKYCLTSLDSTYEGYLTDTVTVYGLEEDSSYVDIDIPEGKVFVSSAYASKFSLNPGDMAEMKDPYDDLYYHYEIAGIYEYEASLAVFMNRSDYLEAFDEKDDYYTGYFTNVKLDDIPEDKTASVITASDFTKVTSQMANSFGEMISMMTWIGVLMYLLLIYLMTKQIIDRNLHSISMSKILGFRNTEIAMLYLVITTVVVAACLLVSVPLIDAGLHWGFTGYIYTRMTGYFPYIVSNSCFVKMILMGALCYAAVCAAMLLSIRKIPMSEALKNME